MGIELNLTHVLDRVVECERREIVSGLLAEGEVALLTAHPGVGKSLIAVNAAVAVACGRQFLGRDCKAGPVVYVATERAKSVPGRFMAHAIERDDPVYQLEGRLCLTDAASVQAMIEAISAADICPRLFIVDTLSHTILDVRENDAGTAEVIASAFDSIRTAFPDAAILVVHHLSKDGSGPRGSSGLLATADLELRIKRSGKALTISVQKANSVDENQSFHALVEVIHSEGGQLVRAVHAVPETKLNSRSQTALRLACDLGEPGQEIEFETWRRNFLAHVGGKPDTARQRFKRAHDELIKTGCIEVYHSEDGVQLLKVRAA